MGTGLSFKLFLVENEGQQIAQKLAAEAQAANDPAKIEALIKRSGAKTIEDYKDWLHQQPQIRKVIDAYKKVKAKVESGKVDGAEKQGGAIAQAVGKVPGPQAQTPTGPQAVEWDTMDEGFFGALGNIASTFASGVGSILGIIGTVFKIAVWPFKAAIKTAANTIGYVLGGFGEAGAARGVDYVAMLSVTFFLSATMLAVGGPTLALAALPWTGMWWGLLWWGKTFFEPLVLQPYG